MTQYQGKIIRVEVVRAGISLGMDTQYVPISLPAAPWDKGEDLSERLAERQAANTKKRVDQAKARERMRALAKAEKRKRDGGET
jgi:uncharacterized protein YqfA (UPF0365 family)